MYCQYVLLLQYGNNAVGTACNTLLPHKPSMRPDLPLKQHNQAQLLRTLCNQYVCIGANMVNSNPNTQTTSCVTSTTDKCAKICVDASAVSLGACIQHQWPYATRTAAVDSMKTPPHMHTTCSPLKPPGWPQPSNVVSFSCSTPPPCVCSAAQKASHLRIMQASQFFQHSL